MGSLSAKPVMVTCLAEAGVISKSLRPLQNGRTRGPNSAKALTESDGNVVGMTFYPTMHRCYLLRYQR